MNGYWRWILCVMLALFAWGTGIAATDWTPLSDRELEAITATGFEVVLDLGFDLKTAQPNSLLIDQKQLDALQQYANANMRKVHEHHAATDALYSFDGQTLPNIQGIVNNTINAISVSDQALQHAQSLLNIIALGDVAVGVNLTVIVNPGETPFTVTQTNINWSDLLSSLTPTPAAP